MTNNTKNLKNLSFFQNIIQVAVLNELTMAFENNKEKDYDCLPYRKLDVFVGKDSLIIKKETEYAGIGNINHYCKYLLENINTCKLTLRLLNEPEITNFDFEKQEQKKNEYEQECRENHYKNGKVDNTEAVGSPYTGSRFIMMEEKYQCQDERRLENSFEKQAQAKYPMPVTAFNERIYSKEELNELKKNLSILLENLETCLGTSGDILSQSVVIPSDFMEFFTNEYSVGYDEVLITEQELVELIDDSFKSIDIDSFYVFDPWEEECSFECYYTESIIETVKNIILNSNIINKRKLYSEIKILTGLSILIPEAKDRMKTEIDIRLAMEKVRALNKIGNSIGDVSVSLDTRLSELSDTFRNGFKNDAAIQLGVTDVIDDLDIQYGLSKIRIADQLGPLNLVSCLGMASNGKSDEIYASEHLRLRKVLSIH